MTIEKLSSVMYLVTPHKRESVWSDLDFPSHRRRVIDLSGVEDTTLASIIYYINYCPDLTDTWRKLNYSLYKLVELPAMEIAKKFCCISQSNLTKAIAVRNVLQ